jgi:hypothetical protein
MLHILKTLLRKLDGHRYQHNVERALALHSRGEVRNDGLEPINLTTQLQIEWRARDVHPWDRGLLSPARRAAAFVEQSLVDTEAAIHRLFEALPQVDVIALRVLDRTSEAVIISGTVSRLAASARDENLSIGMRLMYLGLTYHSAGTLFEPLEDHRSAPAAYAGGAAAFGAEEPLVNTMFRNNLDVP